VSERCNSGDMPDKVSEGMTGQLLEFVVAYACTYDGVFAGNLVVYPVWCMLHDLCLKPARVWQAD